MILGVGNGTFAVMLAIGVAVLFAVIGCYRAPEWTLFILIGCLTIPLIVYGCILTAPHDAVPGPLPPSPYREQRIVPGSALIDKYLPVRIVVFVILSLATLAGGAFALFSIVCCAPYEFPRMKCLREQLEEAHPTWYR